MSLLEYFFSNDFNCNLDDFFYCDCHQTPYVLAFRLYKLPTYSLCFQLNKHFNRVAFDVISENEVYVRIQDNGLPF